MKFALSGIAFLAVGILVLSATAWAESDENITQEKIDNIREHCVENQASLNRLRQTDAFIRTDRGNLYRTISDKLMVPFNQRLVSNQLDGGKLITIAADFDREYDRFYGAYVAYSNALSELLSIDCMKRPVTFYDGLVKTRTARAELSTRNTRLKTIIVEYGQAFREFRAAFVKENR
jgi:hypothetical protein